MTIAFINSLESEWIKKRRSLASWLVIIGAFFTPAIIVVARFAYPERLQKIYSAHDFWMTHWRNCWESIAIFLLPVGIILAASLITQLEYRNNTWKQLHTTPLSYATIYFSKILVIVAMMVQFFFLFNVGIFLSGFIPPLFFASAPFPSHLPDWKFFWQENLFYFIDCLPMIGLQYLLALQYRNFLVPIGAGFLLWVASIATLKWKYGFAIPYTYTMFNFLKVTAADKIALPSFNFHLLAAGYFVFFVALGYLLYVSKRMKG